MKQKVLVGREKDRELLKERMIDVAIKGLINMFDNEKKLFCYRVKRSFNGVEKEGTSYRYTIMSLLGLYKCESGGKRSPINIQDTVETLVERSGEINNIGDHGLLLWLCALAAPENLSNILFKLDKDNILNKYPDARQRKTMELAWFLTGLSYCALASREYSISMKDLTIKTYELLKENYGFKGIFGHQSRNSFAGKIRARIGSFADQIYPVYALSKFGNVYGHQEALQIASECGRTICLHQGPLGQWWWHYDSTTGNVLGKYPVYSVHQDGMAPMALFALGEAAGLEFTVPIYKGLDWISGNNELDFDLIDASKNLIWRSFFRKKYKMWWDEVLSLARLRKKEKEDKDLMVLFECRPYHLGWLLYAFAEKNYRDGETHKQARTSNQLSS